MHVEEFNAIKRNKLSDAIMNNFPMLSYNAVRKIIRNKDVKINGNRVSTDVFVEAGDKVIFYTSEMPEDKIDIIFQDENIVVVFKKRKIETVSESGDADLCLLVSTKLKHACYAVHRLDRNTEGLVVFAKNESAKNSLDLAFKNRTIEKYYLALVYGILEKAEDKMIAYLKKFSDSFRVQISDAPKTGYQKIQTNYKLIKIIDDTSLVEIELVTGKTHQIRAHFAHIGHCVIGDDKYGNAEINKKYKRKYQNLCAYKIIFHFSDNDYLSYLNGKIIELDKTKIDFCQNL